MTFVNHINEIIGEKLGRYIAVSPPKLTFIGHKITSWRWKAWPSRVSLRARNVLKGLKCDYRYSAYKSCNKMEATLQKSRISVNREIR